MRFIWIFLLAASTLSMCGLVVNHKVIDNTYENQVRGHLKRAADAQTVEMAREELAIAVHNLEARNLTSGYTSVFYNTPDEDIGFWYRNLNASLTELTNLPAAATLLERSNILMRLRSTLLHHGDKGESVNEPEGIEMFPSNTAFSMLSLFSLLLFACSVIFITLDSDRRRGW